MSETVRTRAGGDRGDARGGGGRVGGVLSGLAVALGCLLFLGGFVWGAVLYQPYTVPTDSMSPTVEAGARVLAQRIDGSEVKRGDVVVFKEALWGDMPMVKRVVGIGGDKVAGAGGRLTVNGRPIDEPYLRSKDAGMGQEFSVTVPDGKLFLLGDERRNSMDSRVHLQEAGQGSVPRSAVTGRVDAIAWPMDGVLERPTGFAALPGGISEPGPVRLVVAAIVGGAALILVGAAYGPLARLAGRRGSGGRSRREEEAVAA
ncbi:MULTISPECIES: signal peptidase I [Streptomyces]|uniref:Signal peptidase I n=1 Tax=Streptomyces solicathayae TaxID=3081768 RepID=A0ABZ0LRK5_9ACTN|nr:signal peptidase I [Streptomyces sp. HUAS YS2]WOX21831.1 signal peptidase I [Streptomyces sp. HUAS YS2]